MNISRSLREVGEGWFLANIAEVIEKDTSKGSLSFLRCRITSGKYKGREVDFLVPRSVMEGTHFDRFLVSVFGSLGVRNDLDLDVLVNKDVAIRVALVRKGKRTYRNVVAVAKPERVEKAEV